MYRPRLIKLASYIIPRRNNGMKPPPMPELEFLKLTGNHFEFRRKLSELGFSSAHDEVTKHVNHVGVCWLKLADDHLKDAKSALTNSNERAVYSRSYYALYNASKCVRYLAYGFVSLRGDDHKKASELPDDFTDLDKWTLSIPKIYEQRLRADYDNWNTGRPEDAYSPEEVFQLAKDFIEQVRQYIEKTFGIRL